MWIISCMVTKVHNALQCRNQVNDERKERLQKISRDNDGSMGVMGVELRQLDHTQWMSDIRKYSLTDQWTSKR